MRKRNKNFLINLAGIMASLVIAFGVLILVQNRLAAERMSLLNGSGKVEVPVQAGQTEVQEAGEIEITVTVLTEEELIWSVEAMESPGEPVYHEPMTGQLSMAQAAEYGKEWMLDFLLPKLGINSDAKGEEYRAACFLWTPEEFDRDDIHNPQFSFWAVSLVGPQVDAMLTLNAVTGQVLDVSVISTCPVEYQDQYGLPALLEDYMDSFGLDEVYTRLKQDGNSWTLSRDYGDKELNAVISLSTQAVAVSKYDGEHDVDYAEMQETVFIHLYLETDFTTLPHVGCSFMTSSCYDSLAISCKTA